MIEKRKKTGISEKIKSYLNTVKVDVFGYEKMVTSNISRFFTATRLQPKNSINVRIGTNDTQLIANLFCQGKFVRQISVNELVIFFTGSSSQSTKVSQSVKNYLQQLSLEYNIPLSRLIVRISKPNEHVSVHVYDLDSRYKTIKLMDVINHFMQ